MFRLDVGGVGVKSKTGTKKSGKRKGGKKGEGTLTKNG